MMEKIELSEQINRLNKQLVQRDAEKNTLKESNVELEGKEVAYEQRKEFAISSVTAKTF